MNFAFESGLNVLLSELVQSISVIPQAGLLIREGEIVVTRQAIPSAIKDKPKDGESNEV